MDSFWNLNWLFAREMIQMKWSNSSSFWEWLNYGQSSVRVLAVEDRNIIIIHGNQFHFILNAGDVNITNQVEVNMAASYRRPANKRLQ